MSFPPLFNSSFRPVAPGHDAGLRRFAILALFVPGILAFCLMTSSNLEKLTSFPADMAGSSSQDFMMFYQASTMSMDGEVETLFNPDRLSAAMPDNAKTLAWFYPPTMLLFLAPLALMPYGLAKAVWLCLGAVALVGALRLAFEDKPDAIILAILLIASPVFYAFLLTAQVTLFVAFLLVAGFHWHKTRPILAGICFGLLTLKPHYGLLIPFFLAGAGAWRAFGAAAVTAVLLALASLLHYGPEPWLALIYADGMQFSEHGLSGDSRDRFNFFRTLTKLGLPAGLSLLAYAGWMGVMALAAYLAPRRLPSRQAMAFVLLAACSICPVLWAYQLVIAAIGALMLLGHSRFGDAILAVLVAVLLLGPFPGMLTNSVPASLPVGAALSLLTAAFRPAIFNWRMTAPAWTTGAASPGAVPVPAPTIS